MVYNPKVTIDRIGNRIEKSDISIQEFSKKLGMPCVSLRKYMTGKHEFPASLLVLISQELNVPSDYLLGLTDYPEARASMKECERKLDEIRRIMNR